jgi:predicted HTH transcriptional regulator
VLTQRFARHPALADVFRALGLVEKQGLGVDRMYREMVALGHRPPVIVEDPGPRVRTRLVGGENETVCVISTSSASRSASDISPHSYSTLTMWMPTFVGPKNNVLR